MIGLDFINQVDAEIEPEMININSSESFLMLPRHAGRVLSFFWNQYILLHHSQPPAHSVSQIFARLKTVLVENSENKIFRTNKLRNEIKVQQKFNKQAEI